MDCPYCSNELRKIKTKYKCEKCYKKFTYNEVKILEEEDYLAEHQDTISIMEENNGVKGNY